MDNYVVIKHAVEITIHSEGNTILHLAGINYPLTGNTDHSVGNNVHSADNTIYSVGTTKYSVGSTKHSIGNAIHSEAHKISIW